MKDPCVLEFAGLPELAKYSETDLEMKIIDYLQEFLLELGVRIYICWTAGKIYF